jgi:HK97 family phage major capsid protein
MPTVTELQERRGVLVAAARERLDLITANTEESRVAELEAAHDAAMAELDRLDQTISREERVAQEEARQEELRRQRRPIPPDGEARGGGEGVRPDQQNQAYREAFRAMLLAGGSASELSAEHRNALRAGVAGAEIRAQSTTASAGGYTVPTTLADFMVISMAMHGPMYDENICTVLNTSSGEEIDIPTIDDTSVGVVKTAEGADLTDDGGSDVTVGQKVLNAFVYDTEFIRWSLQLMQDSSWDWERLLGDLLGQRLGRRANTELTVGDGNGDPNGIVTASTLGVSAVAQSAITFDELIDLEHSVDPAYRMSPKCRYMFNDGTLKKLRKLKDGEGRYLWSAGSPAQGVAATLNGRAYSINQAMPASTSGLKPIVFGDFGKYFVRKVGSPIIGVMRERFWPSLGIAGLIRLDGELGDTAAVKHLIMA